MLAQRSAEAARDVAALISATGHGGRGGVGLVKQVGDALSNIVASSQQVAATIGQIAGAAQEQAQGIEEMSRSVARIDDMTQQNAASPRRAPLRRTS